jgi:peptidoglycan-associated lipoprotein
MKRIQITHVALLALGGVLLTASCSSKPKPAAAAEAMPVAAVSTPVAVPPPAVQTDVEPRSKGSVDVEEMNRTGYLKDVFFDYNRYDVRQDQRGTLADGAEWLKAHPTVRISIAGHCDERGTAQYNMALGQQRAGSVKDYLVQLGIDASRIQIISYGNERPFATGHDEAAWAQNRRDHFLVTAG